MSGVDFCADTNFAVYHLGGHRCVRPYLAAALAVSVVTELELLSKPGMPTAEVAAAELYLETCEIIDLTAPVKAAVIGLRRQYRLKLPDAIVAATAQWLGVPLLTADKGFVRIADLDVVLLDPA
ncbi:type II toxin-antitoxin system VapC family toxin [Hymenobacter ruricola]|uniref:Ribonuclease VapC n=1 Tax=Hymenobacter ruricola TaxID=2791023 RepID=A0ABS0I8A5_9BACT|nr:type II toxin-antitoxin system VapC family toxin [Hymenobacter ruricola]MBF9223195.1 type II toxin-antitoxin system VapC family toxin [Hymenobacter ruricola]